jgi:guanine deaminase
MNREPNNSKHASNFALRGDIIYTPESKRFEVQPDGWLVCEDGNCAGVFAQLPAKYAGIEQHDYSGHVIIPGLVDLHTHAPQYSFRGNGMDLELLDWLQTYTFPEEARYRDLEYARRAYSHFVSDLAAGATTRAVIFATVHAQATLELASMLEASGLVSMVGKVNMDRNAPANLAEANANESLAATHGWVSDMAERAFLNTKPILTPRFIPSCTDELMRGLGEIQRRYGLPVQSHLSENPSEIAWVRELCPEATNYADAYLRFGLLGGEDCPTVMAHCVYSDAEEMALLRERGVWVAHCAASNTNLASGIAPVRSFMDNGVLVGLGTDVAGGHSLSMFSAITEAISVSKLRWRLQDDSLAPLSTAEAFYLATKGGGSFWGKAASFENGYLFDAVVLDDSKWPSVRELTLEQRLERLLFFDANSAVVAKYVNGKEILPHNW